MALNNDRCLFSFLLLQQNAPPLNSLIIIEQSLSDVWNQNIQSQNEEVNLTARIHKTFVIDFKLVYTNLHFKCPRVTQPNFSHLLDSTTSIHFIPSKFDHWYKMYEGG